VISGYTGSREDEKYLSQLSYYTSFRAGREALSSPRWGNFEYLKVLYGMVKLSSVFGCLSGQFCKDVLLDSGALFSVDLGVKNVWTPGFYLTFHSMQAKVAVPVDLYGEHREA